MHGKKRMKFLVTFLVALQIISLIMPQDSLGKLACGHIKIGEKVIIPEALEDFVRLSEYILIGKTVSIEKDPTREPKGQLMPSRAIFKIQEVIKGDIKDPTIPINIYVLPVGQKWTVSTELELSELYKFIPGTKSLIYVRGDETGYGILRGCSIGKVDIKGRCILPLGMEKKMSKAQYNRGIPLEKYLSIIKNLVGK